ncbi:MAG: restriction endonuclease subunit R [Herbiconiux sp.]|nr:MAG: restriction endonuclease subunit R [Herbiconiux sp.]
MLTLGTGSAATLPEGWVLAASGFNWTPEIIDRKRSAHDITVGIVADGVAEVVEIEAGQVWRGFPAPDGDEVDALRDGLAAVGGRIGIVGGSIDDWSSPSRRRTDEERLAFLRPQLEAAARAGAVGIRLPIGQAGPTLLDRVLPVLHELELTLFEEVQGQQTPQSPAHREACEEIVRRDDPRLRFVVDISLLMPSLPPSYLERLAAGGVPSELVRRLSDEWLDPATLDAVRGLLGSGGVPPAVHTLYMDLLIRFGRSAVGDLAGILPFTSAVHLKFWDLDDAGGRVSQPIRDIAAALDSTGFAGTLTSEWGGHEWLDDDPTAMTRAHLALARRAITEGLVRAGQ